MTRPNRHLILMAICLLAVGGLAYLLRVELSSAFEHNPWLNAGILIVLVIGIVFIFWQVARLYPEISWIDAYRHGGGDVSAERSPRLLAPMATMLGSQRGKLNLSTTSLRSLLDGIHSRLDESHETSRYLIALLVFLGLLGTFWGLLATINSISAAIGNMSLGSGDPVALFAKFMEGLGGPIAGMGTAFGASLFGLAGSLVLGFLELQASQAHNRFFNELEEWLAGQTRLSSGGPGFDGEANAAAYAQALLDQTTSGLQSLREVITHTTDERTEASTQIRLLSEHLAAIGERLIGKEDGQAQILPVLERLAIAMERDAQASEAAKRLPGRETLPARAGAASGIEPLLRNTAESLEVLRHGMARSEAGRAQTNTYLKSLAEGIHGLGKQAGVVQQLLTQIAEGQADLRPVSTGGGGGARTGGDDTIRALMRSFEGHMSRIGEQSLPAHVQALLVQTAESLERLQRTLEQGEQSRARSEVVLKGLASGIERLAEHLAGDRPMVAQLVASQSELRPILERLANGSAPNGGGGGLDETSRHHIRNIDAYLSRMLEELSIGRQYTVQELRNEIKLLGRTIAAAAEDGRT